MFLMLSVSMVASGAIEPGMPPGHISRRVASYDQRVEVEMNPTKVAAGVSKRGIRIGLFWSSVGADNVLVTVAVEGNVTNSANESTYLVGSGSSLHFNADNNKYDLTALPDEAPEVVRLTLLQTTWSARRYRASHDFVEMLCKANRVTMRVDLEEARSGQKGYIDGDVEKKPKRAFREFLDTVAKDRKSAAVANRTTPVEPGSAARDVPVSKCDVYKNNIICNVSPEFGMTVSCEETGNVALSLTLRGKNSPSDAGREVPHGVQVSAEIDGKVVAKGEWLVASSNGYTFLYPRREFAKTIWGKDTVVLRVEAATPSLAGKFNLAEMQERIRTLGCPEAQLWNPDKLK